MALLKNEIGNKYGLLTVVDRAGSKDGYATWKCKCDCGNFVEVKGVNLRRKGTQSCGCLKLQNTLTLNKLCCVKENPTPDNWSLDSSTLAFVPNASITLRCSCNSLFKYSLNHALGLLSF